MQRYPIISCIHAADIHLGSPFSGLSERDRHIADHLRRAQLRSFDSVIGLCLEKQVDFLLIAGDTFDSEERNLTAILHFLEGMKILHANRIGVVIVAGNHDPLENRSGAPPVWEYLERFMGPEPLFTLIRSDKNEMIDMFRDGEVIARVSGVSFARHEVFTNPVRF
ncbi:MAG: metallophosphoesterase, partial [Methanospirillum sp.]|nr:metallophosphoesterase [Methanospirillum sp.]